MRRFSLKILIPAILVLIFVVLLFLKLIIGPGTKHNNQKTIISPSVFPPYPNLITIRDTNLPTPPSGWTLGNNDKYTVTFPDSLAPTTIAVEGGGTNTIFNPVGITDQTYPEFTIEDSPVDPASTIQDRIEQIKRLTPDSFTQTQTTFRGLPTTQVSEILPVKDAQGNYLQKTFLFFNDKGYLYIVDFAYFDDQHATNNQQMFLQMLNSITLK